MARPRRRRFHLPGRSPWPRSFGLRPPARTGGRASWEGGAHASPHASPHGLPKPSPGPSSPPCRSGRQTASSGPRTRRFHPRSPNASVSTRGGQGPLPRAPRRPWGRPTRLCGEGRLRDGNGLREGVGNRGKGPGTSHRRAPPESAAARLPASSGYSLFLGSSPWSPPPPAPEAAARPPWLPARHRAATAPTWTRRRDPPPRRGSRAAAARPSPRTAPPGAREEQLHAGPSPPPARPPSGTPRPCPAARSLR